MNLSDAALDLAAAGWPVFPVDLASKRPRTKHGHLDATTDETQIRAWRDRFDLMGGIATPTGNGLLVIDIDPRNGGKVPNWLPPDRTPVVKTQSGGWHLYYDTDTPIKSKAGLFGPGVDSKCRGGYVLMPPTPGYEWADLGPLTQRVRLPESFLREHMVDGSGDGQITPRLAPDKWRRGIIHDQAVAWAAYFAGQGLDDLEVEAATWGVIGQAQDAGVRIDNARGHIDTAIRWVLKREASNVG